MTDSVKRYCEGDSFVLENVLDPELARKAFEELQTTTPWTTMQHRGGDIPRLISIQGSYEHRRIVKHDGDRESIEEAMCYPLYRHPADSQLMCIQFTPMVQKVADVLNSKYSHLLPPGGKFNHVLVQYYRTGIDIISEHADKTLDINKNAPVVNVSLGAARIMTLRTKDKVSEDVSFLTASQKRKLQVDRDGKPVAKRLSETVLLDHNTMFVLGMETNKKWVHGIRADKSQVGKDTESMQWDGRISLTFRSIGTFATKDTKWIMGIGIKKVEGNSLPNDNGLDAYLVNPGPEGPEVESLFRMFSEENRSSIRSREEIYQQGSNVILA